jgi:hypothetical protein
MSHSKELVKFMKDKNIPKKDKMELLNSYNAHLAGQKGSGAPKRMTGASLMRSIKQNGGHFDPQRGGSFWSWLKGAANTVYNRVLKPVGNAVYKHAIKPAYEYARDKPVSAVGKVLGVAGMVPSPFSGALKAASAGATAIGSAIGKGYQSGGRYMHMPDGRIAYIMH